MKEKQPEQVQPAKEEKAKEEADKKKEVPLYKATKDTITLELTKPVLSRVRNRVKELQELGGAKHVKEMRGNVAIWHTTAPQIFMSGLDATVVNGVGTITYSKYKQDKEGNKKIKITQNKSPHTGRMIDVNAEYVFECLVVETIERFKPLKSEEVNQNE